ncbi:MAG: thiolase family protein [Gemmataceae bacterium]|nr:thiolase family protein [Gemmataceae bacterium]
MLDIAIVDGVRTPFVRAFGPLAGVPAYELGRHVSEVLLRRAGMEPARVDQVVFGNVAVPAEAANIARVIALKAGIPRDRIAHTVHRNCASGMEAITTAAQLVHLGEADVVLAGGTESMSQIPLLFSHEATTFFTKVARARGVRERIFAMMRFRPRYLRPVIAIKLGLTDPVSGLMMGETAEVLAEEFGIRRGEQDEYALQSHQRTLAAQKRSLFAEEIVPIPAALTGKEIVEDIGPRDEQSLEALAKLKPIFKRGGTVTVGNSCQITDGAAAVLVMSGERARGEGRAPLGYLRAFAYAGCDPRRMGLGPIHAVNKLLKKTGMNFADVDLIEINEAFAAQVLANERAFASPGFAEKELGRNNALGVIDRNRLNVNGGAIALGHPIAATGTRLVVTLLKELLRRGKKRGLATLCVGGGQGAALLLETP